MECHYYFLFLTLPPALFAVFILPTAARRDLHLTIYGFETRAGPNTTLLLTAGTGQGNLSAVGFGSFLVFDNILRVGPSNTSKELGRHQGTAVGLSLEPITIGGLYMTAQHIFQSGSGQYNGSSITVMGTVANAYSPYLLLIPGGLGYFFGCTGYAICATVPATPPLFVFKWDFHMKCV